MTKREAAVISAYTGILFGDWADTQAYFEKELRIHPLSVSEERLRELVLPDLIKVAKEAKVE